MLRAADLFCGAGGTSAGARDSGAVKVTFALNHWDVAVKTHSANFPEAKHVNSRLDMTHPSECGKIDLLFASPECTHHSNARGGRPMEDQKRAGAWDVLKWVEHHRPSWVVIENVREFKNWGPLNNDGRPMKSGLGKFFDAWLMAIRAAGYKVDHQMLNAADYGAATSRDRLFVIARRGNRSPIFPDPTHSKNADGNRLPGMSVEPWRAAAEIIDWRIPCPSIFSRKRPLADKTLRRIEMGLRKFVGPFVAQIMGPGMNDPSYKGVFGLGDPLRTIIAQNNKALITPFIAQWDQTGRGGNCIRDTSSPLYTMVTKANMGLVMPFAVRFRNNMDAAGVNEPLGTLTAGGGHNGVAVPFITGCGGRAGQSPPTGAASPIGTATAKADKCLAVPYMIDVNHGDGGQRRDRSHSIDNPLGAATSGKSRAICLPFLAHYYGTNNMSSPGDPLDTVTAKERHSLICPELGTNVPDWRAIQEWESEGGSVSEPFTPAMLSLLQTMAELGVADIGFRMLANHELSLAQGFSPDYQFFGSKADVTRQIGNSVSPNVAKAISQAIAG